MPNTIENRMRVCPFSFVHRRVEGSIVTNDREYYNVQIIYSYALSTYIVSIYVMQVDCNFFYPSFLLCAVDFID